MTKSIKHMLKKINKFTVDKVLFEYDYLPIEVIVKDSDDNKYIAINTDPINNTWIITKVNNSIINRYIDGKISLKYIYERANNIIYLVNEKDNKITEYEYKDFPEDEKPIDWDTIYFSK